jgi:two-component system, cell cycle sensor histidine kinase and response regulator CckA
MILGICLPMLELSAQSETATGAESVPLKLTRIMDFWSLSNEIRSGPVPVELEVEVLYNDPVWGVTYLRDESGSEYVEMPSDFGARFEDVVRLEGRTTGDPFTFSLELDAWSVSGHRAAEIDRVDLTTLDHVGAADRMVMLSGLVERQSLAGDGHLSLEMVAAGYPVTVYMLMDPQDPVPQLTDSIISIKGVYSPTFGTDGQLVQVEVWSPEVDCVQWLAPLAEAPEFEIDATEIASLLEPSVAESKPVRVQGTFVRKGRQGGLILRDESGQVTVRTAQRIEPEVGRRIEVVGVPVVTGVELELVQALWRPIELVGSAETRMSGPMRFHRYASSVRELSPMEAATGESVALVGTVTWSDPDQPLLFLQDGSSGIALRWDDALGAIPPAGKRIQVEGVTAAGDFAPFVAVQRWEEILEVALPVPRAITRDQAMTGLEDGQLVELIGFVYEASSQAGQVELNLSTSVGEIVVRVASAADGTRWLGAVVQATGVCVAQADASRRLVTAEIWVAGPLGIEVLQDGVENPFELPLTPMSELGRFNPNAIMRDRLRVEGTVVWVEVDGGIWINEEGLILKIHTRQTNRPAPRERIEVVGFLGMEDGQRILRESVWRSQGVGTLSPPDPLAAASVGLEHGKTTRIEGRVETISGWSDHVRLLLRVPAWSPVIVEIPNTSPEQLAQQAPVGSVVDVLGLVLRTPDPAPGEPGLRILVPDLAAINTVEFPPWWTPDRLAGLGVIAGLLIILALLWVVSLRRLVRSQTDQISTQNSRARQLQEELERTQRMESLGSMAAGIARDFEALLQRSHSQIGETLSLERLSYESRNRLDQAQAAVLRAQDLTRRLASFSLTGKSTLAPLNWVEFLRREIAAYEMGPAFKLVWNLPESTATVSADAGQLQQVMQAVLRNAIQAMPDGGTIKISLSTERIANDDTTGFLAPGNYYRMSITDSGNGIALADLDRVFEPYFTRKNEAKGLGLSVAYAVIRQHRGRIEIDSTPGQGTTVLIWLPAVSAAGSVGN